MLNYIKSEGFRALKNKNIKIMIGICMALMFSLVAILYYFKSESGFSYANTRYAVGNIYTSMTLILILTLVIVTILDDSEYKNHTIKHSVAFGISREEIYFGRFLVMVIASTIIYVILTAFLAITSYFMLNHSNVGEYMILARISLGSFTCLIAGLSVTYYFFMSMENPAIAATWSMVLLFALPAVFNLLGMKFEAAKILSGYMPSNCIDSGSKLVESNGNNMHAIIVASIVGAVWTVAFLAFGMLRFQKKEIK